MQSTTVKAYAKCTDHPGKMYKYASDFFKPYHQHGCKQNDTFILCFVHYNS